MAWTIAARELAARILRGTALAVLMLPGLAAAQSVPGNSEPCDGVPNCQYQQQTGISYGGWDTKGWAYYCTGDHPYFWGDFYANVEGRWVQTNSCFETTENRLAEQSSPNKLDVTVTNWCAKREDYVISLACSSTPPPGLTNNCSGPANPVKDPGCPIQGNIANHCISSLPIADCFQTWQEQCGNTTYWCTQTPILGLVPVTSCLACSAGSN